MKIRPVVSLGLAAVVVGIGILSGLQLGQKRDRTASSAPKSIALPAEVPRTITTSASRAPFSPGCPDPDQLMRMPLRDKLSQLLMVGVKDEADARSVVANYRVGGIFITSWTDLSMLRDGALTELSTSASPLPLLVSVDEEGGRVSRLSPLIGPAPSARVVAQTVSPNDAYRMALERGSQMRSLGINVDFAPVVDVTAAPDNTVIGDRSFGSDPRTVTQFAGQYARGLRDAGVLPVLKHFPGHGRASGDSHQTGVTTPPLDQLIADDLVPYRSLVALSPVGVMVGHMQVPGLTGTEPASLSKAAIDLLRNGVGYGGPRFDGLVFTDDLSTMKAITDRYSVAEAVLKAIKSGADVALWVSTNEVPGVLERLESAASGGELSFADIDKSVGRIATAKAPLSGCFS